MATPLETIPSETEELAAAIEELTAKVETLVTEDETPVDNLFSEKQQRLLTEPLYSCWSGPPGEPEAGAQRRPFLVAANVGLFPSIHQPPLVPDVFLSLDVQAPPDIHAKRHRTYFFWEFGKAPEVVIEIVSNREGNELGRKLRDYARMGIGYYVVYDPLRLLGEQQLYVFERRGGTYEPRAEHYMSEVGLGLRLWEGVYEGILDTWLRWCDQQGTVIPTGAERAARLAAKLRELGVDPDQI